MKNLLYIAIVLFAISKLFNCSSASHSVGKTCILGFCFGPSFELEQREISTAKKTFTVTGYTDGEFSDHQFSLGEHGVYEGLSFGLEESDIYDSLTVKKRMHILNDKAYQTYLEKYLRVKKQCPASFVHQNLETALLIPASDEITQEFEHYELPFSPDGTPFKFEGYVMTPKESYAIRDGNRLEITLARHEGALSNVGSAQHLIRYFLVTRIH